MNSQSKVVAWNYSRMAQSQGFEGLAANHRFEFSTSVDDARETGVDPRWRSAFIRLWRQLLALTRLSSAIVCEESASLGCYDFHTHDDAVDAVQWFAEGGAHCQRCGKRFRL